VSRGQRPPDELQVNRIHITKKVNLAQGFGKRKKRVMATWADVREHRTTTVSTDRRRVAGALEKYGLAGV
jgi:hypothetical protein